MLISDLTSIVEVLHDWARGDYFDNKVVPSLRAFLTIRVPQDHRFVGSRDVARILESLDQRPDYSDDGLNSPHVS